MRLGNRYCAWYKFYCFFFNVKFYGFQLVEQIDALKKELEKIDENIARQTEQRNDLDKTLNEADLGLKKVTLHIWLE